MQNTARTPQGFSLVQVTIILTLFAIALAAMLPGGQQGSLPQRTGNTAARMQKIMMVLKGFEAANGRLPCPADATLPQGSANYGVEAANQGASGGCTGGTPAANLVNASSYVAIGALPVKTLALPNTYAVDDYGREFSYAVDTRGTKNADCVLSTTGGLSVTDSLGNASTAMAVLISHGANGHGAYIPLQGASGTGVRLNSGSTDTDELDNASVDSGFVSNSTTINTSFASKDKSSTYDDIVVSEPKCFRGQNTAMSEVVYVADNNNHVQRFNGLGVYMDTFSSSGTGPGQLTSPLYGIVADANKNVWIADGAGSNGRVQEFSASGTYLGVFGSSGCNTLGKFCYPGGLAIDAAGNFWATGGDQYFQKFNNSGVGQAKYGGWGSTGSGNGYFWTAYGITVDPSQNVWVADPQNTRVQEFNGSGTFIRSIGGPSPHTCQTSPTSSPPGCAAGTDNGQFSNSIGGLASDSSGNIYVADTNNNRIVKFNNSGSFLYQIGVSCTNTGTMPACVAGTANGQFNKPGSVAVDGANNLWVADSFNFRIQEFDSSGNFILKFGSSGSGNGQFATMYSILVVGPSAR